MKGINEELLNQRLVNSFKYAATHIERNKHYYFKLRHGEISYFDWVTEEESCWGSKKQNRYAQNEQRVKIRTNYYNNVDEIERVIVDDIEETGNTYENKLYLKILIDDIWNYLNLEQKKLFAIILHENGLEQYSGGIVQCEILEIIDSMDLRTDGQVRKYEKCQNLGIKSSDMLKIEESLYYKLLPKLRGFDGV